MSGTSPHSRPSAYDIDHSVLNAVSNHINWSRFAYSQYATDVHYLCNSVMVFESLFRLGSKADRILFYPKQWDTQVSSSKDRISQLLVLARDTYHVKLIPTDIYGVDSHNVHNSRNTHADMDSDSSWDLSVNKLLAFDQTSYRRIVHIDSDVTILQNLDELFLLPGATKVAMPRAYWNIPEREELTSLVVVLEPSHEEVMTLAEIANQITTDKTGSGINTTLSDDRRNVDGGNGWGGRKENRFDMEVLNQRYRNSATVLPHRSYALLTGEFRKPDHSMYLGSFPSLSSPSSPHPSSSSPSDDANPTADESQKVHRKTAEGEEAEEDEEEVAEGEIWDPDQILKEAKLVHFSDWPLPKPWVMWPYNLLSEIQPACDTDPRTANPNSPRAGTSGKGGGDRSRGRATSRRSPSGNGKCRNREIWKGLYDDFRRRRRDVCRLLSVPAPKWPPPPPAVKKNEKEEEEKEKEKGTTLV